MYTAAEFPLKLEHKKKNVCNKTGAISLLILFVKKFKPQKSTAIRKMNNLYINCSY